MNVERQEKKFVTTLYDYQEANVNFGIEMERKYCGALIYDEMGMGKTLTFIALNHLQRNELNDSNKKLLVVCQKNVITVWKNEFAKHTEGYKVKEFKKNTRVGARDDVVLITYGMLVSEYKRREHSVVYGTLWNRIVLDEGHLARSITTKRFKAIEKLKEYGYKRWISTGTPMQNEIHDFWSLFYFVDAPNLIPITEWKCKSDQDLYLYVQEMNKQMSVRTMCGTRLPNIFEFELSERFHSKEEQALYDQYHSTVCTDIERYKEEDEEALKTSIHENILVTIHKLRKLCICPALVDEQYSNYEWATTKCTKMLMLERYCAEKLKEDEKLLIYTEYLGVLDLLEKKLPQLGLDYLRLDGAVTKCTDNINKIVQRFNNEKNIRVLIISVNAANTGLNLQVANKVIFWDPFYNPQKRNQAKKRVHRIGQTKEVVITDFLITNTIEVPIRNRAKSKNIISKSVLSQKKTLHDVLDSFDNAKASILGNRKKFTKKIDSIIELLKPNRMINVDEQSSYEKQKAVLREMSTSLATTYQSVVIPVESLRDDIQQVPNELCTFPMQQRIESTNCIIKNTILFVSDWECTGMEVANKQKLYLNIADAFLDMMRSIADSKHMYNLSLSIQINEKNTKYNKINTFLRGRNICSQSKVAELQQTAEELKDEIALLTRKLETPDAYYKDISCAILQTTLSQDTLLGTPIEEFANDLNYIEYEGSAIPMDLLTDPEQITLSSQLIQLWLRDNYYKNFVTTTALVNGTIGCCDLLAVMERLELKDKQEMKALIVSNENTQFLLQIFDQTKKIYITSQSTLPLLVLKTIQETYSCFTLVL